MTHTYEWMDGWIQFVRNGDPFFFCKTKKTSEINRKEKKTSVFKSIIEFNKIKKKTNRFDFEFETINSMFFLLV